MKITFYGAARTVTGSCHMVEASGKKFLVDCGMFQGRLSEQIINYEEFPFDLSEIDFVILTHAHIDHSGRIPKLYKQGYKNTIYATTATLDLCSIMLPDSGHIQEKEIEWVNKKRIRAGKSPNEAMYTAQDGVDSLKLFKGINYDEDIIIDENIRFKMKDAGHMLGSAIVEIYIKEAGKEQKIVFTGDLGNTNMPIINDPEYVDSADYLVIESTYGDRLHGSIEDQSAKFIDIILKTIESGGNLIIPSFAVGRTQEILYEINKFLAIKGIGEKIKKIPVYVDSPLAVNATKIFEENPRYYDDDALRLLLAGDNPLDFENLHFVQSSEESKALNEDTTPKIIISASGMCEVGRIKHHLKHNLYKPNSTVLFVGYQAEGTLGKKILSGEKLVKIFGEEIAVNASIEYLDSFSGHADRDGLLNWIEKMQNKPKNIFIVHGEYESATAFKNHIYNRFKISSVVPGLGESYTLDGTLIEVKQDVFTMNKHDIYEILAALKTDVDVLTNRVKAKLKTDVELDDLTDVQTKLATLKDMVDVLKTMNN